MLLSLLLALQAPVSDVTVTGTRVPNSCAEGGCAIRDDVKASVATAEAEFMAGSYLEAKRTLQAAIGRQRAHAAEDPVAMGTLFQALTTVSLHDGDMDSYQSAAGEQLRVTKAHLAPDHPAVVNAEFGMAAMWTKIGQLAQAERTYVRIAKALAAAGKDRLSMLAGMRAAWLADTTGDKAGAREQLAALEARPTAADPEIARALRVVALRIAGDDAGRDALDALAARIAKDPPDNPTLVFAPPLPVPARDAWRAERMRWKMFDKDDPDPIQPNDVLRRAWVDVGFQIRPDGTTTEAALLRGSRPTGWAAPVLEQIGARRYSPYDAPAGTPYVYRVERLTQRATFLVPTGSRIRQRVGPASIETTTLTDGER